MRHSFNAAKLRLWPRFVKHSLTLFSIVAHSHMILFRVDDPANAYFPNAGNNGHLVNQVGQTDFKFDTSLFVANVSAVPVTAKWNVRQSFSDQAGVEVSSVEKKDVSVSIPAGGGSVRLSPMAIGSLPMFGVDTKNKRYLHRITVSDGTIVLADLLTPYLLNMTDTVFDGPTVPFEGSGPADTNVTARAELAEKEGALASNVALIVKKQDENKVLQPRVDKLKALLA